MTRWLTFFLTAWLGYSSSWNQAFASSVVSLPLFEQVKNSEAIVIGTPVDDDTGVRLEQLRFLKNNNGVDAATIIFEGVTRLSVPTLFQPTGERLICLTRIDGHWQPVNGEMSVWPKFREHPGFKPFTSHYFAKIGDVQECVEQFCKVDTTSDPVAKAKLIQEMLASKKPLMIGESLGYLQRGVNHEVTTVVARNGFLPESYDDAAINQTLLYLYRVILKKSVLYPGVKVPEHALKVMENGDWAKPLPEEKKAVSPTSTDESPPSSNAPSQLPDQASSPSTINHNEQHPEQAMLSSDTTSRAWPVWVLALIVIVTGLGVWIYKRNP